MTDAEKIMAYEQMVDDLVREHRITDFEKEEYFQEACRKLKRKVSLTEEQKNVLHGKLNAITSGTGHVYEFIETREDPVIHTRLYCSNPFVDDIYDTIAGYIVSFQAEKFKKDILYPIEELLDEHI